MASSGKKTTRKPSKKQQARERSRRVQRQKNRMRVISVVLFALGGFLLALTLIPGENAWLALRELLFGLFGVMAYAVGPLVIFLAFLAAYQRELSAGGVIFGLLTLLSACGALHIFSGLEPADERIIEQLIALYQAGAAHTGGGLAAFPLGWTLLRWFGRTGASVTIVLLLFVFVMLLTGKTVSDIVGGVRSAAKDVKQRHEEKASIRAEVRAEREKELAIKRTERQAKQEERKARRPIDEKMIDVPLADEPSEPAAEPVEPPPVFDGSAPQPELTDEAHINDVLRDIRASFEKNEPADPLPAVQTAGPEEEKTGRGEPHYRYPPIHLLKKTSERRAADVEAELRANADKLVSTLDSFGVKTTVLGYSRGPTVSRYELQPAQGVKVSRISSLADDLALNLATTGVRIEAPIPNKAAVGIEVPNRTKSMVGLRTIIESEKFRAAKAPLTIAMGLDIDGQIRIADIADMPHMLVAGTTGSGKSVCLNCIILSLIYKSAPEDVRMILIDPKSVELTGYNGIPHLLVPVVTDPKKAAGSLTWAVSEMMKRYRQFAEAGVKTLDSYNRKLEQDIRERRRNGEDIADLPQKLPHIVIIIDELSDLMMVAPGDVEDAICRLAQLARAAGMHLIVATQRPTVDVVTGLIKANIPSRVAFAVKDSIDSRTILGMSGAEKLLGKGDMLYMPIELNKPVRLQGCFVSEEEINSVIDFVKQNSEQQYSERIIQEIDSQEVHEKNRGSSAGVSDPSDGHDAVIDDAIELVVTAGQASATMLQSRLKVGYARAARIIDEMEQMGIVGPRDGSKPREVKLTRSQWIEMKMKKDEER